MMGTLISWWLLLVKLREGVILIREMRRGRVGRGDEGNEGEGRKGEGGKGRGKKWVKWKGKGDT